MRIGGTSGIGSGFGVERRVDDRRVEPAAHSAGSGSDRDRPAARPASRALVATTPPRPSESPTERMVRRHAHAPFLAQLIATREDLPETRRRRRADPVRAARLYADTMDGPGLLVPGYLVDTSR